MKTIIFLKEAKPENILAHVELEVVPRGLYEIEGKTYQYIGQPKFIIDKGQYRCDPHRLMRVELIVEEYHLDVVDVKENPI